MTYDERVEEFNSKLFEYKKKHGLGNPNYILKHIYAATEKDELPAFIRKMKVSKPNALYLYMLSVLNDVALDEPDYQISVISDALDNIKESLTDTSSPLKDLYKELWSLEL